MDKNISDSIVDKVNDEKYNNLRMIQINTYYSKRYQAYTKIIKRFLLYLLILILLVVLAKKNIIVFIPTLFYKLLGILIILVGTFDIIKRIFDLMLRDNMDYDKYSWSWNKYRINMINYKEDNIDKDYKDDNCNRKNRKMKEAEKRLGITDSNKDCEGETCCDKGTFFDDEKNKCVPITFYESLTDLDINPWNGKGQFDAYDNSINYSSA